LTKEDIFRIIDIELDKLITRVRSMDLELELTEVAKNYISEKGYDSEYGARPLKRAIQKYIEDPLTEEIIKSNPKKGSKLLLDYDSDNDVMVVTVKKEKSSKKKI
jgi:ATP-dependent Clp protease ATP-binding subunit ClpC